MECSLVELFHWPLSQIDATDMESLIGFVLYFPQWRRRQKSPGAQRIFADEAGWL